MRYNAVARGLANYYSFVDNYYAIVEMIRFTLLHSCAKTLAQKLNLGSRAAAFKKFGANLTPKDDLTELEKKTSKGRAQPRLIKFFLPDNYKKTRTFKTGDLAEGHI